MQQHTISLTPYLPGLTLTRRVPYNLGYPHRRIFRPGGWRGCTLSSQLISGCPEQSAAGSRSPLVHLRNSRSSSRSYRAERHEAAEIEGPVRVRTSGPRLRALGEIERVADIHRENGFFLRVRRPPQGVDSGTHREPAEEERDRLREREVLQLEAPERRRRRVEGDRAGRIRAELRVREIHTCRHTAVAPVRERELPSVMGEGKAHGSVAEESVRGIRERNIVV